MRVLSEERLHRGRVFDLVYVRLRLPSGLAQELDVVAHGGAVAIAATDARGRLLVVRQYRAAAGAWTTEIPAGRLEPGENPLSAARRELEEETGHRADGWRFARRFLPAAGFCSEVMHLYAASGVVPVPGGGRAADDDEEIEVAWRTPDELLAEEPQDAKTLVAALALLAER